MRKITIVFLGIIVAFLLILLGYYKLFVIGGTIIKVDSSPKSGFNYDYYVYLPYGTKESEFKYILVEPNNGGRVSDNHVVHEKDALSLVKYGACHKIAQKLKIALLVPVFDRPESNWRMYTHSLDRDTLMCNEGNLARIDLQLINMIKDLKVKLRNDNIIVNEKVFMSGFSASGSFANRFTALHPEIIKAVAAGGVNCMPIIPTEEFEGRKLIYPIGISDIKDIADIEFNIAEYKKVSQYIYMGNMDKNDTLPYEDAFSNDERELIISFLGNDMHERWERSKEIYMKLNIPAQMVMYDGVGHEINDKIINDLVEYFKQNNN